MQAVILAAGRGVRLRPLTYHVPKSMLRIAGKNILEHNIDQLPRVINELVFVIGYLGEQIVNHFGQNYKGRKVIYLKQQKLLGTGHALRLGKDILGKRFLVMMGDDIYSRPDIEKCLLHEQCMLTREVNGKFIGGRITLNSRGDLQAIIEGVHNRKRSLVNTGLYMITRKFFRYDLVPLRGRKEYGLPQTLVKVAKDYPVRIEKASFWLQINNLAELERAKKILTKKRAYAKVKT